jgi:hypothetical protein
MRAKKSPVSRVKKPKKGRIRAKKMVKASVEAPTSDDEPRPNNVEPLAAKPPIRNPYPYSQDYGNRREMVSSTCNYVNQILEYHNGNTNSDIALPDQANTDARMPLFFLRPACLALNGLITGGSLAVPLIKVPTDSLDYTGFVPLINLILTAANAVNNALP